MGFFAWAANSIEDTYTQWKTDKQINQLMKALENQDEVASNAIRSELISTGEKAAPKLIEKLIQLFDSRPQKINSEESRQISTILKQVIDEKTLSELTDALDDQDPSTRHRAAYVLGAVKDDRTIPKIIDALKNRDYAVRGWATTLLWLFRDRRAVPGLIEVLNDDDSEIRCGAARVLNEIDDQRSAPAMIDILKDEMWETRRYAVRKIGNTRDRRYIPLLLEALKDDAYQVRASAITSLIMMHDPRAVEGIIDALNDPYEENNEYAFEYLASKASETGIDLCKVLKALKGQIDRASGEERRKIFTDKAIKKYLALADANRKSKARLEAGFGSDSFDRLKIKPPRGSNDNGMFRTGRAIAIR